MSWVVNRWEYEKKNRHKNMEIQESKKPGVKNSPRGLLEIAKDRSVEMIRPEEQRVKRLRGKIKRV